MKNSQHLLQEKKIEFTTLNNMELVIKTFDELSNNELFDIFKLRFDVFVLEQACLYQDIDEFDKKSYHVFYKENETIVAYLRVLPHGVRFDETSIGRVISVKRRCGLGTKIVKEGVKVAKEKCNAKTIFLEAQTYARKLYESIGFKQCGEEFLEDGIPHIPMRIEL